MRINVYDGTGGRDGKVTPSLLQRVINRLTYTLLNVRAVFTGTVDFTNANVVGLGGGAGTVQSIQGDFIDNTDPANPVIVGVENVLKQCKNDTGVLIPKGTPVKVVGVHGELPSIQVATASNTHVPNGSGTNEIFGIAFEDIGGSSSGPVLIYGSVENVNTLAYEVGDFLYVSPTGTLVNTPPAVPYERICIGLVIKKNATEGVICVRTSQPTHVNDLVGMNITNVQGGDVIKYDLSTNTFTNTSTTALGLTTGTGTANKFTIWSGNSSITSTPSRIGLGNSIFIGSDGTSVSTGVNNVAIGVLASTGLTAGSGNVSIGYGAQNLQTDGSNNVTIGLQAAQLVSGSSNNVTIGALARANAGSNVSNTVAIGYQALRVLTTGVSNTAVGYQSLLALTTGNNNTALGNESLKSVVSGVDNTAIGTFALAANTSSGNTAIGKSSCSSTTSGGSNTAMGNSSLQVNTTGSRNTVIGNNAAANGNGSDRTAVGNEALRSSTTSENTAVGSYSLTALTSGLRNTAVGYQSIRTATTANDNTSVGSFSLRFATSSFNTAVGSQALSAATTGFGNTAIGAYASSLLTTANENTSIGQEALGKVTSGNSNIGIGNYSGYSVTTGYGNVCIGRGSGADLAANSANSVIIGNELEILGSSLTNYLAIGNLIFGNNTGEFGYIQSNGAVGIGDPDPVSRLSVSSANITSATSAFTVRNGLGTNMFNVRDDGRVTAGGERVVVEASNTGSPIGKLWTGTQAQYDALPTYDAETLYIIA